MAQPPDCAAEEGTCGSWAAVPFFVSFFLLVSPVPCPWWRGLVHAAHAVPFFVSIFLLVSQVSCCFVKQGGCALLHLLFPAGEPDSIPLSAH